MFYFNFSTNWCYCTQCPHWKPVDGSFTKDCAHPILKNLNNYTVKKDYNCDRMNCAACAKKMECLSSDMTMATICYIDIPYYTHYV